MFSAAIPNSKDPRIDINQTSIQHFLFGSMSKWCRPNSLWNRINQVILKYSSFSTKITMMCLINNTLQWHHNESDCLSNHQPNDCLLNRLFRHRWKKTSELHVTGLCAGNSTVTSEFPAQRASNAKNVSIWWRHHELFMSFFMKTRQIWGIWKLRPAYSPETPNLGQNRWCFVSCDLEIWWMTLETIGHLSFAVSSFVQHFVAIGELKLELQSGNAQFGSNWTIFRAVWPWNLTYDLEQGKSEGFESCDRPIVR